MDLTQQAPRSPRVQLGGFVVLARTLDKCRAMLANTLGEYDFDCELDKTLLDWKGLTGDALKEVVKAGATDEEIAKWVRENGIQKSDAEIAQWTADMMQFAYQNDAEGRVWLEGQFTKLGLPMTATLFDYLDADDKVSFA